MNITSHFITNAHDHGPYHMTTFFASLFSNTTDPITLMTPHKYVITNVTQYKFAFFAVKYPNTPTAAEPFKNCLKFQPTYVGHF